MPDQHHDTSAFEALADHYAAEMSAQFRTLSLFVRHAGEVGRSHEVFLAQVLTRFLPEKLRIGTGFVFSPRGSTRQQDIIVYDWQNLPLPLKIGDCVVVDADAVAAMIEVKTRIGKSDELREAMGKVAATKMMGRGPRAVGIYAWEGLSLDTALQSYWAMGREAPRSSRGFEFPRFPDFLYVRGAYLLTPSITGQIDTPPLRVLRLGEGHANEGLGMLALLAHLWLIGIQHYAQRPWWLEAWSEKERRTPGLFELIPWPKDLQELANERAARG
jgi:hypothetical protein